VASTIEPASSLRRALALIRALSGDEAIAAGGLGVTRLAEITGADKSRVSRALQLLADEGFVERSGATRAYRLGWQIYAMAARSGDLRMLAVAPPHLERLTERFNERSYLSVRHGDVLTTVLSRSPRRSLETASWTGLPVPLHSGAAGRALLMGMPDEAIHSLLGPGPYPACGPRSPRTFADLIGRLEAERAQGWVLVDEEFEAGRVGVAAPVRDFRGETVAALNVSAPKFRFEIEPRDAGARLVEAAAALSRDLGSPPAPSADLSGERA
jgi:IclR family transcriptional regulator, KDG regulon repressor